MNASKQAQQAYSAARGTARTPRRIEYETLGRLSARMRSAAAEGPTGFTSLARAVHDNRRLWTVFAAQAVSAENHLPDTLKSRILYLSEFTRQHSSKVLARSASVEPLLDINAAVMAGLRDGAAA